MVFNVCFVLFVVCFGTTQAVNSEILSPVKTNGVEAALIIVPGAAINGDKYKPLAQQIQRTSNLKLWVALLEDFPLNFPNPLQLNGAISTAISKIQKAGMKTNNVFVAGHSLGGVLVGNYGKSAHNIKGIVLLASYLTKGNKLSSYPLPVLTVSGDLDGLTRCTRLATTFQELKEDVHKSPNSMYRSPVIIMKGVNHGQFASGTMPSNVLNYDLKPEVDFITAHKLIAKHVNDFLVATIGGSSASAAKSELARAYTAAAGFFEPLLMMQNDKVHPFGSSSWTAYAQGVVSGVGKALLKITDTVLTESSFISSKPAITADQGRESVTTYTHLSYPRNVLDVSTVKSSPDSLDVKLKSKDAVFAALPDGVNLPSAGPLTCMDINKHAWDFALLKSSATARSRYQRSGRRMKFTHDKITTTGQQWISSKAAWTETTKDVTFQSTSLLSKVNMVPTSLAGMYYCKLLSPYRAVEWIYVDSLRRKVNKPSLIG